MNNLTKDFRDLEWKLKHTELDSERLCPNIKVYIRLAKVLNEDNDENVLSVDKVASFFSYYVSDTLETDLNGPKIICEGDVVSLNTESINDYASRCLQLPPSVKI